MVGIYGKQWYGYYPALLLCTVQPCTVHNLKTNMPITELLIVIVDLYSLGHDTWTLSDYSVRPFHKIWMNSMR